MSDVSNMLGGTPPAPPPGDGATPPPAPPPPGEPPAGTPSAPTPPAAPTWLEGMADEDKALIETKGFKTPADAIKALRDGEAANKPPETPEGYELPVPQGEDPAFSKAVAPLMHKAGLSPTQAKVLAEGWNEMQAAERATAATNQANAEREHTALLERQKGELKREWGEAFDANSEHVRRAWTSGAAAAGIPAEQMEAAVDTLGKAIGFPQAIKMFAFYGQHFAEDTAHGLGQKGASPSAAATRLFDKSKMNP